MTRITSLIAAIMLTALSAAATVTITPSRMLKLMPVSLHGKTFTSVATLSAIDIEYTQSPNVKVELEIQDNLLPYIKIEVSNSRLTVNYKEDLQIVNMKRTPKLIVYAPDVNTFITNSSGDIEIRSDINSNTTVKLTVNSAGDIKAKNISCIECKLTTNSAGDIKVGNINANSLSANANSAGDIEIGSVVTQNATRLNVNSAGDIECANIIATNIEAKSQSSGDIEIKAANADNISAIVSSAGDIKISRLNATIVKASGGSSGDITLSGNCQDATLTASTASSINAGNLKALNVTAACRSISSSITCNALQRCEISNVKGASFKNVAKGTSTIIN
ncbi:MAG: hypothetical protein HFJ94_09425 [Muribaculaceae bacterium]|nr:hypothetical protein [Muribaculaceae bacterium]